MNKEMIHYYFFKNLINSLPNNIISELSLSDDKIFYYANIMSIDKYYSIFSLRRDKVKILSKIKENFNQFYTNSLINISEDKNINNLIFAYSFLAYNMLEEYIGNYVNTFKPYKLNYYEALNMIDLYFYKKIFPNQKKPNIRRDFKDLSYDYKVDKLMHSAVVKSINQTGVTPYFYRCNKKRNLFYKHYNKFYIKPFIYLIDIFRKNKRNKAYYYKNKIDENLLNNSHQEFIVSNIKYNYSIDELIEYLIKEMIPTCEMINNYLADGNDKEIRIYFNIPDEKEM